MIHITLKGRPITKKNSQRIIMAGGHPRVIPSEQFETYQRDVGWQIRCKGLRITYPVQVTCIYYMPTHHKVDLTNLLEATDDILVHYKVLADDNSDILVSHDGSRVLYDKQNPRVEITISHIDEG